MNALTQRLVCVGREPGPTLCWGYDIDRRDPHNSRGPLMFWVPFWGYATDEEYAKLVLWQSPTRSGRLNFKMLLMDGAKLLNDEAEKMKKRIEARMEVCNCYSTLMQRDLVAPDHQQDRSCEFCVPCMVRVVAPLGGPPTLQRWTFWQEAKAIVLRRVAVALNFVSRFLWQTHKDVEDQIEEDRRANESGR